ncbi:cytochrome c oxidase subunit 4 [Williamsia sterculiae]|uniref:Cytochrome c oxidase polypeptide 4 n=1 Tax=Williamsia sterculiae TaxID=1344003 RepID=A0A1N7H7J1_9NOCA|nr:cytochrome c oxidase subunit 4 [Williamsia sterculiae]SIS20844.1 Cytochrome c oxidase subunit IV [Williamsia sterculiae]
MRIEARLFELLTAFFFATGVLYAVCTGLTSKNVEWVGTTGIIMTGGLTLITGTYFRFVARRVDIRPEDYDEAEVADGSGELGFFSPGSWWPIVIAGSAGMFAVAGATRNFWFVAVAVLAIIASAAGLVFEYHTGPEKH